MWTTETYKPLVYAAEDALREDIGGQPLIVEITSFPEFMYALRQGEDQITLALARDGVFIFEKVVFNPFIRAVSIVRDSTMDQVLNQACERQDVLPTLQYAMAEL